MNKNVRLNDYLNHIVTAIERIEEHTIEVKEKFYESSLIQDAVLRNLEIVDEASTKIKVTTQPEFRNLGWTCVSDLLYPEYATANQPI